MKLFILKIGAAHGFGQLVTIAVQFFLPPVLMLNLGVDGYGYFLVSQSIGSIFALYEMGIIQGLQNYIFLNAKDLKSNAQCLIARVTIVLVGRIICIAAALILLYLLTMNISILNNIWVNKNIWPAALYGVYTALTGVATVLAVHFAYNMKEAKGVIISNILRFLDICVCGVASFFTKQIIVLILCMLIFRLLMSGAIVVFLLSRCKLSNILSAAKILEVKKLGYSFAAQGLAMQIVPNALPIIILNSVGPVVLALVTVARTLSRVPIQISSIVNGAFLNQLTRLNVEKSPMFQKMVRLFFSINISAQLLYFIFSALFLEKISKYWLKGTAIIDLHVYILLSVGVLFSVIQMSASLVGVACGGVKNQTLVMLFSPLVLIFLVFLSAFWGSIFWVAAAIALGEIIGGLMISISVYRLYAKINMKAC